MALPAPRLTPKQYLENEQTAEYKSEYYRGETFAMAGGSPRHARLGARLINSIMNRLDGHDCEAYTSDVMVLTDADGLYTYPEMTIVCGPLVTAPDAPDVAINPKVIVEILSKSTKAHDRGFKFQQYKQIETLEQYILVLQTEPLIESFFRDSTREWTGYGEAKGIRAKLTIKCFNIEVPLADIYRLTDFEA